MSRLPSSARALARLLVTAALVCGTGAGTCLQGCAWMYPTAVPMHAETYRASPAQRAPVLLVLLPGSGDAAHDFADHGFIDDIRASGLAVDVIAADAHLGYYLRETVVDRLWTDIVEPARRQGYRHIWLAGISMGGLGAIINARDHADAYERLFLLAPYVGPKDLVKEIDAAGGPAAWTPTDLTDPYQRVWVWLKQYADPAVAPGLPEMTLGFGTDDSLAPALRVLARVLPADQVHTIEGKHKWDTWRQIWKPWWAPGGAASRLRGAPVAP